MIYFETRGIYDKENVNKFTHMNILQVDTLNYISNQ